jgi:hypothetical protein
MTGVTIRKNNERTVEIATNGIAGIHFPGGQLY